MEGLARASRQRLRLLGLSETQIDAIAKNGAPLENVAFAAYASGEREHVDQRALELLALVGLDGKADSLPSELSGGEAQRVALARALAQRPRLLLCDEPTGQLDTDTTGRVLELVDALQTRERFTLVIATHDPDVAARLSRLVELRDGRIVGEQ